MKYFTMEEFTNSETAEKYKINNKPNLIYKNNIIQFVNNLLDPLREAWSVYCKKNNLGKASIIISSGFRSYELNQKIGGSQTSAHSYGWAADLQPSNGKLKEFKKFCREWLEDKKFDQMISEHETNGIPKWIHIGYRSMRYGQRKQFLYTIPDQPNKYKSLK